MEDKSQDAVQIAHSLSLSSVSRSIDVFVSVLLAFGVSFAVARGVGFYELQSCRLGSLCLR